MSSTAASAGDEPEDESPAFSFFSEVEQHLPEIAGGTFSGVIVERDRELVDSVLAAFTAGIGKRRIARAFGLSPHTVRGIVQRAEASGRIAPYKQRMSARLAQAIELGVEQYIEALEEGKIAPGQIPVGVGILTDKKALLDGEATARVERTDGPSVQDVIERMRRAKGMIDGDTGRAIDSE
jgi:DNA-binding Lrp family transcriptional regulator